MQRLGAVIKGLSRAGAAGSFLNPYAEAVVGVGLIVALGFLVPSSNWGLLGLKPHPLWLVVLAIAVRYGGVYGYFSGGLSGTTYAVLLLTRPQSSPGMLDPHAFIEPALMLALGAAIGEITRAREARLKRLEGRVEEADRETRHLHERLQAAEGDRLNLERSVAFQTRSVVTFCEFGRRFQSLDLEDLHRAIVELTSNLLEIEACRLYACRGDGLVSVAREPKAGPPALDADPLLNLALRERKTLSIRDQISQLGARSGRKGQALMAGPLLLSGGRLYGLVAIEAAPFRSIDAVTTLQLEMILRWSSAALENAMKWRELRHSSEASPTGSTESDVGWLLTPRAIQVRE